MEEKTAIPSTEVQLGFEFLREAESSAASASPLTPPRSSRIGGKTRSLAETLAAAQATLIEAPLSDIHLENMLKLSRMGVVICPPMPGFYQRPDTIDDLVNHSVVRMLDQFGIHLDAPGRWGEAFALGMAATPPADSEEL